MSSAPTLCPICGSPFPFWRAMNVNKTGISAGKALAGAFIAGPVGAIIGGAMGKKQTTYICGSCGFSCAYDYQSGDDHRANVNSNTPLISYFQPKPELSEPSPVAKFIFCFIATFISLFVAWGMFGGLFGWYHNPQEFSIGTYSSVLLSLILSAALSFDGAFESSSSIHINAKEKENPPVSASLQQASSVKPIAIPAKTKTKRMSKKDITDAILASNFDAETIKRVVTESGMNVNERDSKGRTLLMILAAKAPVNAVLTLISMGADSRIKDKNGLAALDYARHFHNSETETLLNELRNFIS